MQTASTTTVPTVCVLLSLFNGMNYLEDQIISLALQQGVRIFVFARDDGSSDDTQDLFKLLCLKHGIEHQLVSDGRNLGPAMSFFELIRKAPTDYDYYALCDQDDFWLPQKLRRAADQLLKQTERPTLYASSLAVTLEDLSIARLRALPKMPSLAQALIENHITGCSIVINRAGRESLISTLPSRCIMHDWWIYIHFCALGRVILDPNSLILYRQHNANHVGMNISIGLSLRERWRRHFAQKDSHPQVLQAKEYLLIAGDWLDIAQRQLIQCYANSSNSFMNRIRLALDLRFRRTRLFDTFLWRLLVLFNRH